MKNMDVSQAGKSVKNWWNPIYLVGLDKETDTRMTKVKP